MLLDDHLKRVLELANTNSFTRFVFLKKDNHLSNDVCPYNSIEDILEFLLKRLFYGC